LKSGRVEDVEVGERLIILQRFDKRPVISEGS
jgi:hypothetical protein